MMGDYLGRWFDGRAGGPRERMARLAILILWVGGVAIQMRHHAMWRDEVRALSFALDGDGVAAMLRGVQGDGHPALWYLLLRIGHDLTGSLLVLPGLAALIGAAAIGLMLWRAPLGWPLLALFAFGRLGLFEFVVMARNYGIALLFMVAIAATWERWRDDPRFGLLLALLANSNFHSAMLAGLFLAVRAHEVWQAERLRWSRPVRMLLINAALYGFGLLACFLIVYPPTNDAATGGGLGGAALLLNPAAGFGEMLLKPALKLLALAHVPAGPWLIWAMSALMIMALLGLARHQDLMVAGAIGLLLFVVFFTFVYKGYYRHQALWLSFLMCLYWIAALRGGGAGRIVMAGRIAFLAILALQIPSGAKGVVEAVRGGPPQGMSRDLAAFVEAKPDLRRAIIIADPDYLVEALPYYIDNPTWLLREQRFGRYAHFVKRARIDLSLDDILASAQQLRAAEGRPVIILLAQSLDESAPPMVVRSGYNWRTRIDPGQIRRFRAQAIFLRAFRPAKSDEAYDAWLVR
jgi:hypothetical protein